MADQDSIIAAYVDAMGLEVKPDFPAHEPRYNFPSGLSLLQSELVEHEHFAGFSQGVQNKGPQEEIYVGKSKKQRGLGKAFKHIRITSDDMQRVLGGTTITQEEIDIKSLTYDGGYALGFGTQI